MTPEEIKAKKAEEAKAAADKEAADKAAAEEAKKAEEAKAAADKEAAKKEAKKALPKVKKGRVLVKALNNLSGKYLLPYSKDNVFTLSENAAKELIENKDAEEVK